MRWGVLVAALVVLLFVSLISPASALLSGWCYYQDATINNTGSNLTNYQVMFVVNTSSGTSSGSTVYLNSHSESDLDDLRFTDTSDNLMDYWIESTSNPYTVWVEVPSILNSTAYGNTTVRLQYGNAGGSAASNGTNTFPILFDDFLGVSINATTWTASGDVTVSSGVCTIYSNSDAFDILTSKNSESNINRSYMTYIRPKNVDNAHHEMYYTELGGGNERVILYMSHIVSYPQMVQNTNSAGSSNRVSISGLVANTWTRVECKRTSTPSSIWTINSGSPLTHTTYAPTGSGTIYIVTYRSGAQIDIDWIAVRSFTNIEPSVLSWSGESNNMPVAVFSGNVTYGYPSFPVLFTDASTNTPATWNWTFETIGYSSSQNPTQWFNVSIGNTPTSYDVFLYANNTCGGDWENKSDYITAYPLNASFYANITEGYAPLPVEFNSTITDNGTPTTWWWDFTEDGVVDDTNQTPIYIFTSSGLYNISLNVSNTYSWDWENKTNYINVTETPCDPIVADFTSNVTEGYPEFAVQFTSTSTNATAWDWYFPNGGDSHTEVATWTFDYVIGNTVTTYNISLNASSDCDFEWENKTNYIVAYPLNASFSMNATTGCNPLTVQFTDLTDNGTATAWNWSFDDGTYSDLQSPVHTFTSEDTFTVTLNASNLYSWDVEEKVDVITVTGVSPVSDFTANVTEGYPAFAIAFTDTSTNSPDTWDWNFGDGETDVVQNPEHTYDSVIGNTITTYTVSLNASNTCGNDTEQKDDYITAYPLNASFGANVTSGYQALPVQFTDYSDNGTATSWYYEFGDGNTCSTEQNPINIYTTTGGFTVLQNVSNAFSWDWENKTYFITVLPNEITAQFSANNTELFAAETNPVQFTDLSTADGSLPDTWEWYVDDYLTDWTQEPILWFGEENQSTVICNSISLNASNPYDYDWENKSMYICSYPLNASFTANVTTGCGPLTVEFSDLTDNGTPNRWNWSFGDGFYAENVSSTTHTYTSVGTYDVRLTSQTRAVSNTSYIYSTDDELKVGYISVTGLAPGAASFVSDVTEGYPSFDVTFNDTTGAGPATYYWDFGDGETSTNQNETHTYNDVLGNALRQYTVSFNLSTGCGYVWENKTDYITSYPLNASYSMNITTGCSPLTVQFTDISDNGTAQNWWWDFDGDDVIDDWVANPVYVFTTPGTYNVTMNVSNAFSYDWENKTNIITVTGIAPVSDFSTNVTSGYPSFVVAFTDTSTNSPNGWYWNFGDGETSTDQNPEHAYDSWIGDAITKYTVSFNSSNGCGSDWENKTDLITAYPLNASFSVNATSGDTPLAIQFTDLTDNGTPTNWWWDFNGDDIVDDTNQSPAFTYTSVGTYSVHLNASNAYSYDWYNVTNLITANAPPAPPVADFTANVTEGYPNFTVQFTDTSTESPSDWDWYIDDVKVSDLQNPEYAFDDVIGNSITQYDVFLYAANGDGGDWENKSDYVTAYPLNASFSINATTGCSPLTVQFTDLSDNGTPIAWNWSFDDGTYSDLQNPTHTFTTDGWTPSRTFNVTLNVSNAYSWDIETEIDLIDVIGGTPIAGLSANATSGYPPFAIGFIDASGFSPTSWYWDFGDGDTDTVQNPVHTYDSVIGNTITTYTVGINASNACGYDWANVSNYITAYPLNSSFGANVTNGDAPLVVGFTSFTDNGTATNWWWDFNEDGMVDDTNESPTYIYATPGTYNVTMNASNAYSFCWYNLTDYITANTPPAPPVASFTANVTYGYPNFTVQFTDTSTESPSDWDWYVDDVKVSDTQNLQYAFDDVIGNTITYYDIYLYAANGDGGDWENKSNYIVAYPLNASFSGNPTIGNSPLAVAFTDLTDNGTPATWYWEFGDTGTAGIQNPGHTYNADGLYNVSLNASNTWSWDIEEKLYYINVTANYTPTPTPTTTTTVVVSGGQGTVSVSSATTGSGLTYPLIILGFGGIAIVAVVGLVVFGIRRRRRNDEDDW